MKPAFSVILFTVSSGAGLGLIFWLALSRLAHSAAPSAAWWMAGALGVALLTLGLLSSTRHLANPKNAWRSFARFRTSWLSREGVFAVLLYAVGALYVLSMLAGPAWLQNLLGIAVMALALVVLGCTAMIYACLRTIPRWNNWQTVAAYPLFGLASGALVLMAIIPAGGQLVLRWIALALLLAGALVKFLYFRRYAEPGGPGIADALRLRQGRPRLLDIGHTHPNFLMREFCFRLDAGRAAQLRVVVALFAFVLPVLIVALAPGAVSIAAVSCLLGLGVERWLFFAEARHVVRLYHGEARV